MRDGSATDLMACAACGRALAGADPRRRYCSAACRSRAHRRRRATGVAERALVRRPVTETVYACPGCEARHLGERRCPDCNLFCRSLGPGGACPCCDEPVAVADLVPDLVTAPQRAPCRPRSGGLAAGSPASGDRREAGEKHVAM
jgi:hypothetical protein